MQQAQARRLSMVSGGTRRYITFMHAINWPGAVVVEESSCSRSPAALAGGAAGAPPAACSIAGPSTSMLHYIAGWSHRAAGDAARGMNSGQRSKRNGARRISGSGQTAPINDKIIMLTYNNDGSCGFLIDITLISQTERTS
jgi:hypothetical protein